MLMEDDLTQGGKYTVQYTDQVLQNCVLQTYIILLTKVIPVYVV